MSQRGRSFRGGRSGPLPPELVTHVHRYIFRKRLQSIGVALIAALLIGLGATVYVSAVRRNDRVAQPGNLTSALVLDVRTQPRLADTMDVVVETAEGQTEFRIYSGLTGFDRDLKQTQVEVYLSPDDPNFVRLVEQRHFPPVALILVLLSWPFLLAAGFAGYMIAILRKLPSSDRWVSGVLDGETFDIGTRKYRLTSRLGLNPWSGPVSVRANAVPGDWALVLSDDGRVKAFRFDGRTIARLDSPS